MRSAASRHRCGPSKFLAFKLLAISCPKLRLMSNMLNASKDLNELLDNTPDSTASGVRD